jgi:hypothetical protein
VTLRKGDQLVVQVRFRGGTTETLTLPRPLSAAQGRRTDPALVATIDRLLDDQTDAEVAATLNAAGWRSFDDKPFHGPLVTGLRQRYRLPDHRRRLQARGLLTERELATVLGVAPPTVEAWWRRGYLRAERANDKGERLYYPPGDQAPVKHQRKPPRPMAVRASDQAALADDLARTPTGEAQDAVRPGQDRHDPRRGGGDVG